jgi:hypothetical protein
MSSAPAASESSRDAEKNGCNELTTRPHATRRQTQSWHWPQRRRSVTAILHTGWRLIAVIPNGRGPLPL